MPTSFRYLAACALSVLLAVPPARACGDKMLIIGHDLRMQIRSASVISYAPPGSPFSAVAHAQAFRTAGPRLRGLPKFCKTRREERWFCRLCSTEQKSRFNRRRSSITVS